MCRSHYVSQLVSAGLGVKLDRLSMSKIQTVSVDVRMGFDTGVGQVFTVCQLVHVEDGNACGLAWVYPDDRAYVSHFFSK